MPSGPRTGNYTYSPFGIRRTYVHYAIDRAEDSLAQKRRRVIMYSAIINHSHLRAAPKYPARVSSTHTHATPASHALGLEFDIQRNTRPRCPKRAYIPSHTAVVIITTPDFDAR